MSAAQLWDRLQAAGLVEGERPGQGQSASPWFVRVMLGIAGWIGALFLIAFLGVGFVGLMDSAPAALILGTACCGGAWALFRNFDGSDFVEQFALVVSLVGQALIAVGIGNIVKPEIASFFLLLAAAEAVLAFAIANFLHRILATGGAALALALAIGQLQLYGMAAPLLSLGLALVWLEPRRWAGSGSLWRPVGYGLLLALLLVEAFRLFGAERLFGLHTDASGWFQLHGPLLGRALTAIVLVAASWLILRREAPGSRSVTARLAIVVALFLGLVSVNAPGLGSALLILLLGFSVGNRILIALGILSLLGFVAHFYYSLHATLLEKSGLMAVTGICLIAAHLVLRQGAPASDGTEAGHA